jgi:hypothetical protein
VPPLNSLQKAGNGGLFVASGVSDDGTTVTSSENVNLTTAGTFANANEFNHASFNANNLNINSEIVTANGSGTVFTGLTGAVNCPSGMLTFICTGVSGFVVNNAANKNAAGGIFQGRAAANNTLTWGGISFVMDTVGLTTGVSMNGHEVDVLPLNASSAYAGFSGVPAVLGSGSHAGTYGSAFVASTNVSTTQWGNGFRSAHGASAVAFYAGKAASNGVSACQPFSLISNNGGADLTSTIGCDAPGNLILTPVNLLSTPSAIRPTGSVGLPAAAGGNFYLAGGFGTPSEGRIYTGDGSGWQLELAKRTVSTDTLQFKFKDSGLFSLVEESAPSGDAGSDSCYGDSGVHALKCSYNNGTFGQVVLDNLAQTLTNKTITSAVLTTPVLGGETITSSPREPYNILLPGALTATFTGETFTLDKAITVTRVQAQLRTAPSACGTNAIVRLSDGASNVNLTLTAAANDSGAISQNYAAAAVLTVAVQTAAATCTTSPGDANIVIQYRMQ